LDRLINEMTGSPAVTASAAKQSILALCGTYWIASRSPSSGAHSRDPLARNDVDEALHTEPSYPAHAG
jgi:hypothetical protein